MKIENARVNWLPSGLPYSEDYEDVYYSKHDELAESQHVFIQANKLQQRWIQRAEEAAARQLDKTKPATFTIAELGFGAGLNFMQTAKLWSLSKEGESRPSRLNYLAFEKHPFSHQQLQRLHQRWPNLFIQSQELLCYYPDHSAGCHRICLSENITLDLYYGDAKEQLLSRYTELGERIDCWFLDGFSPQLNSRLWEFDLFQQIALTCNQFTTLSSYSVAGSVRRALQQAGFEVKKLEGHGQKRHMLSAKLSPQNSELGKAATETSPKGREPWFELAAFTPRQRKAIIVGAGLAGCSTAYSLAKKGWQVTVVDAECEPAAGASGNRQLALRCRLFKSHTAASEYFLHSFLFAVRQFDKLKTEMQIDWNKSGVLQLQSAMNKRNAISENDLGALYSESVIRAISAESASKIADAPLTEAAWYIPEGGWIEPHSLCQAYLAHPNIDFVSDRLITDITSKSQSGNISGDQSENNIWLLRDNADGTYASEVVIIANSHGASQFSQCINLPLQSVRGQVSEVGSTEKSNKLKMVVSGERTLFPARDNTQLISASYSDNATKSVLQEDSQSNKDLVRNNFSDPHYVGTHIITERVSFRCNASDQLPIVGMLPNQELMQQSYGQLRNNAKAEMQASSCNFPGLYINVAHGSNGLTSAPFSGEYLASLINGDNLPLSKAMTHCINPARFIIRNLKKQRD